MSTAAVDLQFAHTSVYNLAQKVAAFLKGYEGTGCVFAYSDLAEHVGVDMSMLSKTDTWLLMMSIDSAIDFAGWKNISDKGQPARFQKLPKTMHYRKPARQNA